MNYFLIIILCRLSGKNSVELQYQLIHGIALVPNMDDKVVGVVIGTAQLPETVSVKAGK